MDRPATWDAFRAIGPDGSFRIRASGRGTHPLKDLFHFLLRVSWPQFLGLVVGAYLALNLAFTVAFLLGGPCIDNARPGSFSDAFFFSVQTLSTIGYGNLAPANLYGHMVVAVEAFTGLLGTALVTGLMFAKFARPTARVMFSRVACVADRDGQPCFMVRIGNQRANEILDASVKVILVTTRHSAEGEQLRQFKELPVTRPETPLFALSWTVIHTLGEDSPLNGMSKESMEACQAEIVVVVSGLDDTLAQPVSSRRSYVAREIWWGYRFADMLSTGADGRVHADYSRFHWLQPQAGGTPILPPAQASAKPPAA